MPFASDTFTDTAGTELSLHTPSGGGSWTLHGSYTRTMVVSDANRCRQGGTAGASCYYHSASPASAEYDVSADLYVKTNNPITMGVAGRIDTATNTMYATRYVSGSTQWELLRISGGSSASLGTYVQTLATETAYRVKLEVRDAAKKVFIDGVERISSADNAITAAGRAGVRQGSNTSGADGTGYHLDNWEAADAGGGAVYNESAAGGVPAGGAATAPAAYLPAPAAGAVTGGAATAPAVYAPAGAGGAVTGGAATAPATYLPAPAGGAVTGGAAGLDAGTYTDAGAGGVALGGVAAAGAAYAADPAGGVAAGGVAAAGAAYAADAAGGVAAGGTPTAAAAYTAPPAGGAVVGGNALVTLAGAASLAIACVEAADLTLPWLTAADLTLPWVDAAQAGCP
jgi:hypothetical protein